MEDSSGRLKVYKIRIFVIKRIEIAVHNYVLTNIVQLLGRETGKKTNRERERERNRHEYRNFGTPYFQSGAPNTNFPPTHTCKELPTITNLSGEREKSAFARYFPTFGSGVGPR